MDQRRLEVRIAFLMDKIAAIQAEVLKQSEVSAIRRMEDEIVELQGGIKELKLWAKEIDDDPGYGQLVRGEDGMRRPKLPVFRNAQERAAVLENREGAGTMSPEDIRAAREFRARQDAEQALKTLDGRSPYIPEEERGPMKGTL